jgi:anti-sigma B factor antagonist
LSLSASSRDGFGVLSVQGSIDVHTVPDLQRELAAIVEDGTTRVVVDLTAVDFLDSSALGALVGANKDILARNGTLRVVCAEPRLVRIFTITRLDEVLTIVETVDEAVEH